MAVSNAKAWASCGVRPSAAARNRGSTRAELPFMGEPSRLVRVPRTRTFLGQDAELRVDVPDEGFDRHACRLEQGLLRLPWRWSVMGPGACVIGMGPDHRLL